MVEGGRGGAVVEGGWGVPGLDFLFKGVDVKVSKTPFTKLVSLKTTRSFRHKRQFARK